MLPGECTQSMLKRRVETDGTEPKRGDVKGCLVFASDVLPKYYWQSQESSNAISLFRVLLCTQAYNLFLLRSIKSNTGHVSESFYPRT